jgi:hypothetical protein
MLCSETYFFGMKQIEIYGWHTDALGYTKKLTVNGEVLETTGHTNLGLNTKSSKRSHTLRISKK